MEEPQPDNLANQRQSVVDLASRHFMRYGFKSVTMDDIARELGMSKKTLYQLVATKQELIDLVIENDIQVDQIAIDKAKVESVDAVDEMMIVVHYFSNSLREMKPAAIYDLQKYYRSSWERIDRHHNVEMIENVRTNLRRGQSEGLYRTDFDRELIARLFVKGPQVLMDGEHYQVPENRWHVLLLDFMLYHLNGVCSEKGRAMLHTYVERYHATQA